MLIVDMPMPKNCGECPLLYMEIVKCTVNGNDCTEYGAERPSWCPIKGELVRCRECKHFVENTWECSRLCDRFGDEYPDARVYPDWFCADGERNDNEMI